MPSKSAHAASNKCTCSGWRSSRNRMAHKRRRSSAGLDRIPYTYATTSAMESHRSAAGPAWL
eukprot:10085428-Alexandrium_andersonii.AAC.1